MRGAANQPTAAVGIGLGILCAILVCNDCPTTALASRIGGEGDAEVPEAQFERSSFQGGEAVVAAQELTVRSSDVTWVVPKGWFGTIKTYNEESSRWTVQFKARDKSYPPINVLPSEIWSYGAFWRHSRTWFEHGYWVFLEIYPLGSGTGSLSSASVSDNNAVLLETGANTSINFWHSEVMMCSKAQFPKELNDQLRSLLSKEDVKTTWQEVKGQWDEHSNGYCNRPHGWEQKDWKDCSEHCKWHEYMSFTQNGMCKCSSADQCMEIMKSQGVVYKNNVNLTKYTEYTRRVDFAEVPKVLWQSTSDLGIICEKLAFGGPPENADPCSTSCCGVGSDWTFFSEGWPSIQGADPSRALKYIYGDSSLSIGALHKQMCGSEDCGSLWSQRAYNNIWHNCNTYTATMMHCKLKLAQGQPNLHLSSMGSVDCIKCN